jgi:hypothetical protein
MLQGKLVKVVGQAVPLGKNRENCTDDDGSAVWAVVAIVEVGVGEMFLGYFMVPVT